MTESRERGLTEIAEAAIQIGRERRKKMKKLKTALQKHDDETALGLAREIVGLSKEETESAA